MVFDTRSESYALHDEKLGSLLPSPDCAPDTGLFARLFRNIETPGPG
jgi:hypothetical protein